MSDESSTTDSANTGPLRQSAWEWKVSPDGRSVACGGKIYLSQKRVATLGLGLPVHVLASLKEGALPNGEMADVLHSAESRAVYFNKELVDRLQRRFAYVDTGESLGCCRVHNGPWMHGLRYDQPHSENHLRGVTQVKKDLARGGDQLSRDFSNWLETGTGPDGIRVRKVRDTLTGDELVTFRALHEIHDALRL
jgi:hypothetical protein